MAKRAEFINREDRISGLHTPLLQHILSFLPIHNVVQTCVLSKHWRNVWCSLPSLDLDKNLLDIERIDFDNFVDCLLHARDGSNLEKFRLSLIASPSNTSKVNSWIIYALRHNVRVLDIELNMKLTHCVFASESLRELKLSYNNNLNMPKTTSLPNLTTLHLTGVLVQDGQLDDALFSALPCLENLILQDCTFVQQYLSTISACKLKTLIMTGELPSSVDVYSPNLISLKLCPNPRSRVTIRIKNHRIHLIDANIHSSIWCFKSPRKLYKALCCAHSLTLSASFLKSLADYIYRLHDIPKCIKVPFLNLKRLKLATTFTDYEIVAIISILQHSSQIETIILKNVMEKIAIRQSRALGEGLLFFENMCSHLKVVQIHDFQASLNELRLAKFLLKNGTALEKMVITAARSDSVNKENMSKAGKYLLWYAQTQVFSRVRILFA